MRAPPRFTLRMAALSGAALLLISVSACISEYGPVPESDLIPAKQVQVNVDSTPSGAMIMVNGRMVGRAPVNIVMETDEAEDLTTHYSVSASFQSGGGGMISQIFNVHDRAPRYIHFTPNEVDAR